MLDQQLSELMVDEGLRLVVYDDATGRPITPQSFVHGHPSIGIGRALDVHGLSGEEAAYLLANDVYAVEQALSALPWFTDLDPVRRGVLTNLGFNLGVHGLQAFVRLIADIVQGEHDLKASLQAAAVGDFSRAADELLQSKWASQIQASRRNRLIQQLRTGVLGTVPAQHPTTPASEPSAAVPTPQAPLPLEVEDDQSAEVERLNQESLARARGQ